MDVGSGLVSCFIFLGYGEGFPLRTPVDLNVNDETLGTQSMHGALSVDRGLPRRQTSFLTGVRQKGIRLLAGTVLLWHSQNHGILNRQSDT